MSWIAFGGNGRKESLILWTQAKLKKFSNWNERLPCRKPILAKTDFKFLLFLFKVETQKYNDVLEILSYDKSMNHLIKLWDEFRNCD